MLIEKLIFNTNIVVLTINRKTVTNMKLQVSFVENKENRN